jgi:hypothetical protein
MNPSRPFLRASPTLPLSLVLVGAALYALALLGGAGSRAAAAWGRLDAINRAEWAEYEKTPGCWERAEQTDPTLAPCRDVDARVVAKHRGAIHGGDGRGGEWVHYINSLTVHDQAGAARELRDIGDRLYEAVAVGDVIRARVWKQGRITEVAGGRERSFTHQAPGGRLVPRGGALAGGPTPGERRTLYACGAAIVLCGAGLAALHVAARRERPDTDR